VPDLRSYPSREEAQREAETAGRFPTRTTQATGGFVGWKLSHRQWLAANGRGRWAEASSPKNSLGSIQTVEPGRHVFVFHDELAPAIANYNHWYKEGTGLL
jgi:hypothetical protein